jgi:hypothetical protein
MDSLRDFVAGLLERQGAAVVPLEPEGLDVLLPPPLQQTLHLPEMARLAFGGERPEGAVRIGLEGDWLERLGTLLGARGRHAARMLAVEAPAPGTPEKLLDHAIALPNAVWRLQRVTPAWTRYAVLTLRYTVLADERREGILDLGVNLANGAPLDALLDRLLPRLAAEPVWEPPGPEAVLAAPPAWDAAALDAVLHRLLPERLLVSLDPFLRGARRRLARDAARLHAYHEDLHQEARRRAAAARTETDHGREALRLEAIARDYAGKMDDLRYNYAVKLRVEPVQMLDLFLPVQRLSVLIRRRKGERLIHLDWNPLARLVDALPCEAGSGLVRARLVCDAALHLTDPAAQGPCRHCGKPYCRACHPAACPACGEPEPGMDQWLADRSQSILQETT